MSPEELAHKHPRLVHLTDPSAWPSIQRHGLLPTTALLSLFEVAPHERPAIETRRRPAAVLLRHAQHGRAVITDNSPLSEAALVRCLDDGLSPGNWLEMLNQRVFFWPDEATGRRFLNARAWRGKQRLMLVFNTLSVARQYVAQMELTPINTGSTIRRPARRGLATFSALQAHPFDVWRGLRGKKDRIKEVTVVGGLRDVNRHLFDHKLVSASDAPSSWPGL